MTQIYRKRTQFMIVNQSNVHFIGTRNKRKTHYNHRLIFKAQKQRNRTHQFHNNFALGHQLVCQK